MFKILRELFPKKERRWGARCPGFVRRFIRKRITRYQWVRALINWWRAKRGKDYRLFCVTHAAVWEEDAHIYFGPQRGIVMRTLPVYPWDEDDSWKDKQRAIDVMVDFRLDLPMRNARLPANAARREAIAAIFNPDRVSNKELFMDTQLDIHNACLDNGIVFPKDVESSDEFPVMGEPDQVHSKMFAVRHDVTGMIIDSLALKKEGEFQFAELELIHVTLSDDKPLFEGIDYTFKQAEGEGPGRTPATIATTLRLAEGTRIKVHYKVKP